MDLRATQNPHAIRESAHPVVEDGRSTSGLPTGTLSTLTGVSLLVIVASAAACVYLAFRGWGTDPDIFRMILTWQHAVLHGEYLPSRSPGHVVPELLFGALSSFLPSYGTNLFIFGVSALSVVAYFHEVRRWLDADCALTAVALIVSNPLWIISASSANDCGLAVAFLIFGCCALGRDRPNLATALLALTAASRPEFAPFCILALLFYSMESFGKFYSMERFGKGLANAGAYVMMFFIILGLLFLPVLISQNFSLSFTSPETTVSGGLLGWIGRWAYKSLMFFGIPASVLLAGSFAAALLGQFSRGDHDSSRATMLILPATLTVGIFFLMFSLYPISMSALVGVLLGLPLLLYALNVPRMLLVLVALCHVATWFVSPSLVEVNYLSKGPGQGTRPLSASLRPHLAIGSLIREARDRPIYDAYYLPILPAEPRAIFEYADARAQRGQLRTVDRTYRLFEDR